MAFSIVIVDDDVDDHYFLSVALQTAYPTVQTECVTTLEEWNAYQMGSKAAPSLILMDFRFSAVTGLDLLSEIKQRPKYQATPVIMWSGSANQEEIQACYEAGAASFIQKPVSIDELKQNVESLCLFWFETARLPRQVS